MLDNRLQLNIGKTDLPWCATARRHHQLPTSALRIGSDFVNSSTLFRNLGIYFDADLSMRCHVQRTVASCFAVLRQLRSIRRSDARCRPRLVTAGLRQCCAGRLTKLPVQPSAVGAQCGLRRSDHISDTLASFHWLKAPKRVQYKLATVMYRSLNGMAPCYLAADLCLTCHPGEVCGHH